MLENVPIEDVDNNIVVEETPVETEETPMEATTIVFGCGYERLLRVKDLTEEEVIVQVKQEDIDALAANFESSMLLLQQFRQEKANKEKGEKAQKEKEDNDFRDSEPAASKTPNRRQRKPKTVFSPDTTLTRQNVVAKHVGVAAENDNKDLEKTASKDVNPLQDSVKKPRRRQSKINTASNALDSVAKLENSSDKVVVLVESEGKKNLNIAGFSINVNPIEVSAKKAVRGQSRKNEASHVLELVAEIKQSVNSADLEEPEDNKVINRFSNQTIAGFSKDAKSIQDSALKSRIRLSKINTDPNALGHLAELDNSPGKVVEFAESLDKKNQSIAGFFIEDNPLQVAAKVPRRRQSVKNTAFNALDPVVDINNSSAKVVEFSQSEDKKNLGIAGFSAEVNPIKVSVKIPRRRQSTKITVSNGLDHAAEINNLSDKAVELVESEDKKNLAIAGFSAEVNPIKVSAKTPRRRQSTKASIEQDPAAENKNVSVNAAELVESEDKKIQAITGFSNDDNRVQVSAKQSRKRPAKKNTASIASETAPEVEQPAEKVDELAEYIKSKAAEQFDEDDDLPEKPETEEEMGQWRAIKYDRIRAKRQRGNFVQITNTEEEEDPKIFKQTFTFANFNEEEVSVKIKAGLLIVRASDLVAYRQMEEDKHTVKLPQYYDPESVKTSWKDHTMTITVGILDEETIAKIQLDKRIEDEKLKAKIQELYDHVYWHDPTKPVTSDRAVSPTVIDVITLDD